MKTNPFPLNPVPRALNRFASLAILAALVTFAIQPAFAQNAVDDIEVVRGAVKADRKVVIAEAMQLTEAKSSAFWPLYREYRAAMEQVGDKRLELILEYADLYPNVPEDRARAMLKKYTQLEEKEVAVRTKYLKKFSKILPTSKVLRFGQLENRLDLAVRIQIASAIPLVPVAKQQ
jgi:hypothetical protein